MQKILDEWKPASYPAFIPKIKDLYIKHILLKIDPASWPPKQTGQAPKQENYLEFCLPFPLSYKVDIGRKVCCKKKKNPQGLTLNGLLRTKTFETNYAL